VIATEEKAANIKIFKKEDTFCQYIDRYLIRNGYVLLITTPLKKKDEGSPTVLSGRVNRKD
jgi:hypothetical protein